MKKKVISMLGICGVVFSLVACAPDQKEETKVSKEKINESSEVISGASKEMSYTDPKELKENYDVIVIGAGGAGMTAAIQAKDSGANPVVFEKLPVAGGNTAKSSAGMNASETKFEKEQGIADSNDLFYEESLKGGGGTNDPELLRYFVDHSAHAIDWLDSNGITLDNLTTTGGMSVTRTHRPTDGSAVGQYLVSGLERNITEREIPVFVNTNVIKINESDGVVTGVDVEIDGKTKTIQAKAVVVSTGGFGANEEMIAEYKPELKGYVSTNSPGSTGDGIKMVTDIGGATVDMDKIQIHPTVEQNNAYLITEAVRGEGAILVDDNGQRFFNEMETRDKVSQAINELPEKSSWLIFDSGVRDRVKAINTYAEKGFVVESETIEGLAKEISISEENLKQTVDTWNQAVANQKDTEFSRATGMTEDLSKAPFYAIKIAPGIHHTMGGLKINTLTQVLKEDGTPIPALYAAGEVTGGVHGSNRIGGNAVADIVIFGYQAGTQSALYAKENG